MLNPTFVAISGNHINATFDFGGDWAVRFFVRICETEDAGGRPMLEARVDQIKRGSEPAFFAPTEILALVYPMPEIEEALISTWQDHDEALALMGEEKI